MTNAVIESAAFSGKPKNLFDGMRDVVRLQRYILHRVPKAMRGRIALQKSRDGGTKHNRFGRAANRE